jgi:uncharacterized protein DUF1648
MNNRTTMTDRLLLWVPGVIAVALLVTPFAMSTRLPDPIAIHWGFSGSPDGSGPVALIAIISFVVVGAAWIVFVRAYRAQVAQSLAGAMTWFFVVLFGWIEISTITTNLDRAQWQDAGSVSFLTVLVVVLIAGLVQFLVWRHLGGMSTFPGRGVGSVPSAGLELGEHAVWVGRAAAARGFVGLGLSISIGAGVVAILRITPVATISLAAIALPVLSLALLRTRVSSSAVSVSLGIIGVPRATYPLSGIIRAEVIDVRPMAFGGWGYRIVKGARAWIVRAGEGVRLVRPHAFDVVITIDGAEGAAGLINDVLVKEGRFVSVDAP